MQPTLPGVEETATESSGIVEVEAVDPVTATVIAQAPKIYPHIAAMKKNIATALGVSEQQVGVKATTNELMGFIGRGDGIAAMAVASVDC